MKPTSDTIAIEGNSTLSLRSNPASEQIAADCIRLLKTLPSLVSSPGLSDALLHHVFWHYTQRAFVFSRRKRAKATGSSLGDKYACGFYSPGAWMELRRARSKSDFESLRLAHEHVFERSHILEMLKAGRDIETELIPRLIGCVVTREEHARLNAVDHGVLGWDRYVKAGIHSVMRGSPTTGVFEEVATTTLHSQWKL